MPGKILFKPITRKAILVALFLLSAWARPGSVYSQEDAYKADLEASRKLVKQFEKQVAENIEKTAALKALAAKYPLVVLTPYSPDGYLGSGYDFVLETADPTKHHNEIQFRFGGGAGHFKIDLKTTSQNLVVDLGTTDFLKDPEPTKISINDPSVLCSAGKAVVGHVCLERIHDDSGNHFYVLFQVVALEDHRYMAFIWRRLPGGKIVKDRQ